MGNKSRTDCTRATAGVYFDAWRARDFQRLRTVLHPDVEFMGVMGSAHGADECIAGLQDMAENIMVELELHARLAEGTDAITWFDLVTADGRLPTANWSHVEDGLITRMRVTFDPRPLGI